MKKISLIALVLFSFLFASVSFAVTGYYSSKHPAPTSLTAKLNVKSPPTDIIIYNATGNTIYANVPDGGFTDPIYSGGYDNVYNYYGAYYTKIILYGPDGRTPINGLFGQVYCPRASITVYGYNPRMIDVDSRRC